MDKNIFYLDRTPGSLSRIDDIKILICCILSEFEKPMPKQFLNDALQLNETVNYFNFCFALSQLLKDGLIKSFDTDKNKELLKLLPKGFEISSVLRDSIPKFLIDKNVKKLKSILNNEKQKEGKIISTQKTDDGYLVSLAVEDIGTNLFEIKLYAPDLNQADKIYNELSNKTVDLYRCIISILYDDHQSLENIAKDMKKIVD